MVKFFLFLLLFTCSIYSFDSFRANDAFKRTIDLFEENTPYKVKIPIYVSDLPYDFIDGYVDVFNGVVISIHINKRFYDKWGPNGYPAEFLILHELGHAYLGYKHDEQMFQYKTGAVIQRSIMFSINFGHQWHYEEYRDYYLHEFFCRDAHYPICDLDF